MRVAVISDIHANLEALKQVLFDIDRSNVDSVICLGDTIGYGPDPDPVVTKIKELGIPCVMGNHELAVTDQDYLQWFNPLARKSLLWTLELLADNSIHFISGFKPFLTRYDCRFVHGFPPDSATIYLFQVSEDQLQHAFKQMKERICFLGHTHLLQIIDFDGTLISRTPLSQGVFSLNRNNRYIINIGSVGQPRDGDNHAKYVIWDTLEDAVEVKFIPYNTVSVFNRMIAAGLPMSHAFGIL